MKANGKKENIMEQENLIIKMGILTMKANGKRSVSWKWKILL